MKDEYIVKETQFSFTPEQERRIFVAMIYAGRVNIETAASFEVDAQKAIEIADILIDALNMKAKS